MANPNRHGIGKRIVTLGIETATSKLSVALIDNGTVLSSALVDRPHAHDELLVPLIAQTVSHAGAGLDAVTAVAVSAGPGSFTGLRIGLSAAKGLCLSRDIALVLVPTFDAVAFRIARRGMLPENSDLAVSFDARRGAVYCAQYTLANGSYDVVRETAVVTLQEASEMIPSGAWLAGDGGDLLFASYPIFRIIPEMEALCHAESVALLGEVMHARSRTANLDSAEPLYVRDFQTTSSRKHTAASGDTKEI